MRAKKIIAIVVSVLVVGGVGFAVTWGALNFSKIADNTGLYTQDDLTNAFNDGYTTALENEAEYQLLLDAYKFTLSQLNQQLANLNTNSGANQSQIATLENEITTLQNLLNLLNSLDVYIVHFYVDDMVHEVLFCDDFIPSTPTKAGHTFNGWSLTQGGSVVNLATYNVTGNTTFYAVFTAKPNVNVAFVSDGTTIHSYSAQNESLAVAPNATPTKERHRFIGWSVGGVLVNVNNYLLTSATTFTAMWEYVPRWVRIFEAPSSVEQGFSWTYGTAFHFPDTANEHLQAIRLTFAYRFHTSTEKWGIATMILPVGQVTELLLVDKAFGNTYETLFTFHASSVGGVSSLVTTGKAPLAFWIRSVDYLM